MRMSLKGLKFLELSVNLNFIKVFFFDKEAGY
jgi:hypothetical protein